MEKFEPSLTTKNLSKQFIKKFVGMQTIPITNITINKVHTEELIFDFHNFNSLHNKTLSLSQLMKELTIKNFVVQLL